MPDLWMDVDTALAEVPVNLFPFIDDTDFKSIETGVVYNQAGLVLVWNFVTPAGAFTQTAVTPTDTAGDYDWVNQGNGMYTIEMPASGGASINNNTEGVGWFEFKATGILPMRGPLIGFRAAGLNDALIEAVWSATRGLAGTALPAAAADAAGGLPISDAGGLDLDSQIGTDINAILADTVTDGVALANDSITAAKIAAGAIDAATLAADMDTYQAKVVLIDDDSGATDLYLVTFFKNGEPVTTGITSPTIQVIKASDGTDLIASGALTEIGSSGMYKKAETTNRVVDGSGYIAKVQATIVSATRTWLQPIGRDS